MSATAITSTVLTCDVEGCPHHLTVAGFHVVARKAAARQGWTTNADGTVLGPNPAYSDWCPNHPQAVPTGAEVDRV